MSYTKEEINSKIVVSPNVELELKRLIENKMEQIGVFHRVFSRTKTASSLEKKFSRKTYDEEHKVQDLIGVRINLYFQDDIKIVKKVMENLFVNISWSQNKVDTTNFEPMKVNGVFKLPSYLIPKISESTWEMPIDQTFEIQLKTVFFEGWHEVEHDMRYKIQELWAPYESYARRFNSIVATLELCDRFMIDIFEDFAHSLYKINDWAGMIRMHFRIRISEQEIYEEFIPILEANSKELGKKLFRYERKDLIEYLSSFSRDIPISVNMIIALINEKDFQIPEIKEIAKTHKVYRDGVPMSVNERKKRVLRKMTKNVIYNNKVTIDCSEDNRDYILGKAADIMYDWVKYKFEPIFGDFPEQRESGQFIENGYSVDIISDDSTYEINTVHIDQEVAGRVWRTYGKLEFVGDELTLSVLNYLDDINEITEEERINNFSAPGFYTEIAKDNELTIRDVRRLKDTVRYIKGDNNPEELLYDLILTPKRFSPVVVVVHDQNEDEKLDRTWLESYWSADLARAVRNYAHVYESRRISVEPIKEIVSDKEVLSKGVYLFYPGEKIRVDYHSEEEIINWHQTPGENGILKSRDTEGSKAFMTDLIRTIKGINISEH